MSCKIGTSRFHGSRCPEARYKRIDTSPKFLPVVLAGQLLPGTFEHALNPLLDHELDLSGLDERFSNDPTGAPAYPPATLLNLILFADSPVDRQQPSARASLLRARHHDRERSLQPPLLAKDSCD
jgi:hypothetical protein